MNTKDRALEVTTGVGFACRLVRVRVPKGCVIRVKGAPGTFADLKPGDVVRTQYRQNGERNIAETVEVLELEGVEGKR